MISLHFATAPVYTYAYPQQYAYGYPQYAYGYNPYDPAALAYVQPGERAVPPATKLTKKNCCC